MRSFRVVCSLLLILCGPSLGCSWDHLIWIPRSPDADPLYRFIENGKIGYIDQTGKVVVPPILDFYGGNSGGEFHNGLLLEGVADGAYMDATGNRVVQTGFYRNWDFSDGLAAAMKEDGGKWGYINTKGEFVISPRFNSSGQDYVWPFHEGLSAIQVQGKYGYIDRSGEFVIAPQFVYGDSFVEGMARVVIEGPCVYFKVDEPCAEFGTYPKVISKNPDRHLPSCKYTFIDKAGRIITGDRYDYVLSFRDGLAPVLVGQKWGYIDSRGLMVIQPRFDKANPFFDGLGLVQENGLYGFVDRSGKYVVSPSFNYAESFSNGLAVVGDLESGLWYIDTSGKQAIPGKFGLASSFFKGIAHVAYGDPDSDKATFAYIDRTGRRVFTYENPDP